jgi:hypothetical protein
MTRDHGACAATLTVVVMTASTCSTSPAASLPTVPSVSTTVPAGVSVSGTVWIHNGGSVRPFAGAKVAAWVEMSGRSGGLPGVVAVVNGHYVLGAEIGSRVKLTLAERVYQPCAATVAVSGDAVQDVHAVADPLQLGANLPPQLRSQSPTLLGVVFEETPEGRQGVSDVQVAWDSSGGGDIEFATTLTDSAGRYVLCALDRNPPASILVFKPGYRLSNKPVALTGDATTFDIHIQK